MHDRITDRRSSELLQWLLPIAILCGSALLLGFLPAGCRKQTSVPAPSAAASASAPVPVDPVAIKGIDALPVTMKVAQRTTTPVPGSGGQLAITVDDITRGQVMISLLDKHGKPIAGPTSVRQDQAVSFRLGETTYAARILELSNALVGDGDFVTIVIDQLIAMELPSTTDRADPEKPAVKRNLTEKQKIERLLAVVAAQHDAKFIRNGTAYSSTEAADHLRMKMENARKRVRKASDFIERIASRSSVSGKDYLIELPDGRVLTTAEFLRNELGKIEETEETEESKAEPNRDHCCCCN